ncbi:DUF4097 family beta strand repeat-containing protein [Raoultibacter phocaeensis]|uniref:DUF4097 family beta strand repeat-containing protein n=1 Tax=Raoultibacter phocaeensis TaxID=2479841 RepID=UPI00111AADF4|nr:DUF4097 family beta strand repeat-containing protein [Raoultibacter phocaeensis]
MARLTGASYAKITVAILLAVALFAIAGFGASCSTWQLRLGSDTMIGSATVAAGDVKNIEVDWAAGSVQMHVVASSTDEIELIETGEGLTKGREMRWKVSGDTLHIDYGGWFSCFFWGSKSLEIRVPEKYAASLGVVDIDGASGYYNVDGIGCDKLDVDLASGELEANGFTARELAIDVASGKSFANGTVTETLKAHAASGRIEVISSACPRTIDADMASGTIAVSIPENDGFTAYVDKASGSFESQFETSQQGGGTYVHKNGGATFDIDMASGRFILSKTQ